MPRECLWTQSKTCVNSMKFYCTISKFGHSRISEVWIQLAEGVNWRSIAIFILFNMTVTATFPVTVHSKSPLPDVIMCSTIPITRGIISGPNFVTNSSKCYCYTVMTVLQIFRQNIYSSCFVVLFDCSLDFRNSFLKTNIGDQFKSNSSLTISGQLSTLA